MPYPQQFYHVVSRQEKKYIASYTGRPDLNRLLQGEANYWITAGSTPYMIKKKLILADWSIFSWGYHKWSQVRETLARMMDDGFETYLWCTDALTILAKSDLPTLVPRAEMIPTSYDNVHRDAARLGMALDETQILDDYWVDYVIHQREGFYPRYVSEHALQAEYVLFNRDQVHQLLQRVQAPIIGRLNDFYDDDPADAEEDHQDKKLIERPCLTNIQHAWIKGSQSSLDATLSLSQINVANLETVRFYEVDLDAVAPFLQAASSLRHLHFKQIQSFSTDMVKSLHAFESLTLSHSSLQSQLQFLQYYDAKELKSLVIHHFVEEDRDSDESASEDSHDTEELSIHCSFPKLQECIIHTYLSWTDGSALVDQLLSNAPHLIRLQLNETLFTSKIQLIPNCLPKLEVLSLHNSTISPNNLFRLLAAAPNLKVLYFTDGKIFDFNWSRVIFNEEDDDENLTFFSDLILRHLSQAKLKKTQMRLSTLHNLLTIAPDLVPLQLSHQIIDPINTVPKKRLTQKVNLNADTAHVTDLTVKKIFEPIGHRYCPPVHTYRLHVYHDIIINPQPCSMTNALSLNNSTDLELQPCIIPCSSIEIDAALYPGYLFYGQQKLYLTNDWQPLASLSPIEHMIRYHTSPPHPVKIQYSRRDHLYYIKGTQAGWVNIEFTLHVMDESFRLGTLPHDNVYSQFTIEPLELDNPQTSTGFDYLKAIYTQKRGSCSHRSFIYKYVNDQQKIPTRIIHNHCHSFVEVYAHDQGRWKSFDLGGAKIKLTIDSRPVMPIPQQNDNQNIGEDRGASKPQDEKNLSIIWPESSAFDQALRVWEAQTHQHESMADYCKHYLSDRKTRLIHGSSHQQLLGLRFGLDTYGQALGRPLFYVHKPSDLKKTNIHIQQRTDDPHRFNEYTQLSPLYEFMLTNETGIVLVNLSRFTQEEWVRWNVWFDERPSQIQIIGLLYCDDRGIKPGHDFYSRFDRIELCQLTLEHAKEYIPQPARVLTPTEENTAEQTIDFFHTIDWEGILFGSWSLETTGWQYQSSLFSECANKRHIHIQNGPWEDDDFNHVWQEALFLKHLPETLVITRHEGYPWATLTPQAQPHVIMPHDKYKILNPSTLDHFFKRYTIVEQNLQRLPGYLDDTAGQSLVVYVTHTLNDHDWAKLLTHCALKGVILRIALAPDVSLPTALLDAHGPAPTHVLAPQTCFQVIETNDVDTVIHQLLLTYDQSIMVFDLTSYQPSDLLMRLHVERSQVPGASSVLFSKKPGPLELALTQGRDVILRGTCSDDMMDELASTFGMNTSAYLGRCFLVLSDAAALTYVTPEKRLISAEDKRNLWCQLNPCTAFPAVLEPFVAHESFAKLQARYRYFKRHPEQSTDNAWLGVNHIQAKCLSDLQKNIDAATFDQLRANEIRRILDESPLALITGLSGVGKSTFVTENFSSESYTLYYGQDSLRAWAMHADEACCPILFWDEINLTQDLSQLENLMYGHARHLFIDGECYKISTRHKIIGAMNPNDFGAGRACSALIERHGNACLFTPLPFSVLAERIIDPLLKDIFTPQQNKRIAAQVFGLYHYLCEISEHELLISPRELHMIVLLTSLDPQHPNPDKVASYFGYHLLQHVIPVQHQPAFNRAFAPLIALPTLHMPENQGFLFTPSRQEFCQLLFSFLKLRHKRYNGQINDLGGIGGLLVEGEPGIGKTQLVKATLSLLGYHALDSLDALSTAHAHQSFFMMPALWSDNDKIDALQRLFDLGCIVIMDECNSGSMLETVLNDLLMGKSPQGQQPSYRGFLLIAIQNPITMPGRRAASNALNRRLTKVILPAYPLNELDTILANQGMRPDDQRALIGSYLKQRRYAQLNQLTPPTCRDLLRVAQQHMNEACEFNNILDLLVEDKDTTTLPTPYQHEPGSCGFFTASRHTDHEDEENARKRSKSDHVTTPEFT